MTCQYFGVRILWIEYNTCLSLWFANEPPHLQMVWSILNLETTSRTYCSALVLCKEVSTPKEVRSGICLWPLPQRSLREGMTFAIRGLVLIALLNSIVCFVALRRQLHPFLWQFLDSCSWQAGCLRPMGAVAFFPCQTANGSGLEPNSQLFFRHLCTYPFHLHSKTPGFSRDHGHKLHMQSLSYQVAAASEHSLHLEQLVHVYIREALLVLPQCTTELFEV